MSITHTKVTALSDNPAYDVSSGEWNDAHTLPAWTDWSPVIKAGANTATWTGTAKYFDLTRFTMWFISATFTSAVASGTVNITNQPTPLQNHLGAAIFGHGLWLDQGVNFYHVLVHRQSSTEWRFYRDAAAGAQFSVAIGNSPADSAELWGIVYHT